MTEREWLGEITGWAVSTLRDPATASDTVKRLSTLPSDGAATLGWDLLRTRLNLTDTEAASLALMLAVELSLDVRSYLAKVNDDERRASVDVALLSRTVYASTADPARLVSELSASGALQRYALIEPGRTDDRPFLLRQFRPSPRTIELVLGSRTLDPDLAHVAELVTQPRAYDHLQLPEHLKRRASDLASSLERVSRAGERAPVLLLAGPEGAGRRSLLEGLAAELGRNALVIDCRRIAAEPSSASRYAQALLRETTFFGAVPALCHIDHLRTESGASDVAQMIEDGLIAPLEGLVTATAPRGVARPVAFSRGFVVVDLDAPPEADRRVLWSRELGERASAAHAAWAASRYRVTGGVIRRAARSALAEAQGRRDELCTDDLHAGIRAALDDKLSGLAKRITLTQTWDDLVLPADIVDEVREIIARVRHRELVFDQWGLGNKIGKGHGLSILFSGPPGTGKTMIAGIIAAELGLDLYRVDLAQMVSKYIGETEKNLAALFDAAEAGHAVLLFDEADSMFARRTEVKTSTDRYANLEVNFLLQRMESFTGISILTTNLASAIDDAFKRRLSFQIAFPLPEREEREQLWRTLIPPRADTAQDIHFKRLAERFEMSGGYIKNAVVRAAFMAADRGEPLGDAHLFKAAQLEYAAMGKVMHGL